MRPISLSGLLATLSYFLSSVLWAELPVGEEPKRTSVQEVIQKDDGTQVDITGVVLRQVGPRTVLVHDGTAAVEVDIPPDQVPEGGLKPNVRIRIRGELVKEDETGNPELDANQVFWSF
ncbi:NirD/YgiW/YdeI family stress tolerance protein [Sansalvadorimonas sp. 2012CJ34-2]|uniref:NirD/YgiW/YdeI family stress tolerance protein n=1 Tax=Parendozoicomonas callyspongiae TaxID=2942213 RepID=A0ABT0PIE0_9GAMM|nr:NirD/YgiW/YdeI family stress tolerance protein [Sansalvadorimonas sp. 2012CJ34-2]MCL6271157.1 NirD/YgiW/YdeI family stress tolerance protein [Sansalvadorimonas sp. 2012CJ34-2]